jgi:PKD repeat protein
MLFAGRGRVTLVVVLAAGVVITGSAGAIVAPRRTLAAPHPAHQQSPGLTAVISVTGDATVNAPVTLDGSASQGANLQYSWDFGDASAPGSGAKVQHTYQAVNDVTVTLTVRDASGATASTTQALRVIPALGALDGLPVIGQITPASAFKADLALDASGLSGFSVSLGGALLASRSYDYAAGGQTLVELPTVNVVNEDDPGVAPLINETASGIPLANNVQVNLSYSTASGANETATYTTSMVQPPGFTIPLPPSSLAPAPTAAPTAAPAGSPAPSTTPVPASSTSTAAPAPGGSGPAGSVSGYLQAASPTSTPIAIRVVGATATSAPAAPTATPAPSAPQPQGPAVWNITYPTYLPIVGRPANEDDVANYYLTGDTDFHHADDPLVRRWAIKIARNGGAFPNDPQQAADNIYHFVYNLLGIGDPGKLDNDVDILQSIINGDLVPGSRSVEFICIAHAYFVSSLTRELGLPTREETIGLARPQYQNSDNSWVVKYYQEGANQVWYGGAWHHYDTWIGTRDRDSYLDIYLAEAAWYAYSPQHTSFLDQYDQPTGFSGHDFGIALTDGTPGQPGQWKFIEQHVRRGVTLAEPVPASYMGSDAPPAPHGPISQPQISPAGGQ